MDEGDEVQIQNIGKHGVETQKVVEQKENEKLATIFQRAL